MGNVFGTIGSDVLPGFSFAHLISSSYSDYIVIASQKKNKSPSLPSYTTYSTRSASRIPLWADKRPSGDKEFTLLTKDPRHWRSLVGIQLKGTEIT